MYSKLVLAVSAAAVLAACAWNLPAAAPAARKPVRKDFGIDKRIPFNGSKVVGTPDPAPPYRLEVAFPKLKFNEPLAFATLPGSDRLVIAERKGKILTFANDPKTDKADLLLDVGRTVYGLAFHPQFEKNGYVFVTNVLDAMKPEPKGTRISRYQVTDKKALKADPKSEKIIIEWPSGGHNGGCIKFGPDGYLYIVTGDGSGIADELQTGQDLSDLLGAMLRIDVDHQDEGMAYSIPKDNPFVGREGARPENYAYGLRQLWKFSFDPATKRLWGGEVGQDIWEMVYIIQKGGNYGWSVQEGSHPFRPERPKGPTEIIPPIVEHHHTDFRSITGGYVYTGSRLKELQGGYIYGDYDTGRVWLLRYDGEKVTDHGELADTALRIVEFGQDQKGEVYAVDFIGGQLHQLVPVPQQAATPPFPKKLSETGLFASTKDHVVAPGLIPYSVNSPLYSDNALKDRYLALPGDSQIEYNAIVYPQPAPGAPAGWRFPNGTVVVKTFSLEMEAGNPKSVRRLETRLLHCEQTPGTQEVGDQVWRGYTYIWNDEQTDAILADKEGENRTFTIKDKAVTGGHREQVWHFPSQAECSLCHTTPAKYVLGLNTLQLNKDHDYGGVVANQLKTFEHLGLFKEKLPDVPAKLPKLPDYTDASLSLSQRARGYLHANCAHCHMKWGGGNAEFQLLATLDLSKSGTVGVHPGHGAFGLESPSVIAPGHPEKSMVHHRMSITGLGRMPHIASNVIDAEGVKLIREWIKQLPPEGDKAVSAGAVLEP